MNQSASILSTTVTPHNKLPITILTPTLANLRILDTSRSYARLLAMIRHPEKSPSSVTVLHLFRCLRGGACICRASAVGSTMVAIVLMISLEDGEGLLGGCASVVRAFGCLDGSGDFGWRAFETG